MNAMLGTLVLTLALAALAPRSAEATDATGATVSHPTPQQIVDQQTALRRDVLAARGGFKDLSERERRELVQRQDTVIRMLSGRQDVLELMPHDRVKVFNELEWIKATVSQAEKDRKVCERIKTVGSNRVQTICMTAEQKRKHREDAVGNLQRPQMCNHPSCGPDG